MAARNDGRGGQQGGPKVVLKKDKNRGEDDNLNDVARVIEVQDEEIEMLTRELEAVDRGLRKLNPELVEIYEEHRIFMLCLEDVRREAAAARDRSESG